MNEIKQLLEKNPFEYDKGLFLEAAEQAYQYWQQNENYKSRVENLDAPTHIEKIEDLYEIPTVDMAEFKDHPMDLSLYPDSIKDDFCLFSSGTTTGIQSKVPKTPKGHKLHREIYEKVGKSLLPNDIGYFGMFSPSENTLSRLPLKKRNKSLFKYAKWAFEQYEPDYLLKFDKEGEIKPGLKKLVKHFEEGSQEKVLFGAPPFINRLNNYLEQNNFELDFEAVITAGGWKGIDGSNKEKFRGKLLSYYNIEENQHLDLYGFSESMVGSANKFGDKNPDKKRVISQGFVYVADENHFLETGKVKPLKEENAEGLAVFIDPLNPDYPGVILTDDIVKKTGGEYGEDVRIEHIQRASM